MRKYGSMRKFKTIVVDKSSLYTALAILSAAALLVYGAIAWRRLFIFSPLHHRRGESARTCLA